MPTLPSLIKASQIRMIVISPPFVQLRLKPWNLLLFDSLSRSFRPRSDLRQQVWGRSAWQRLRLVRYLIAFFFLLSNREIFFFFRRFAQWTAICSFFHLVGEGTIFFISTENYNVGRAAHEDSCSTTKVDNSPRGDSCSPPSRSFLLHAHKPMEAAELRKTTTR